MSEKTNLKGAGAWDFSRFGTATPEAEAKLALWLDGLVLWNKTHDLTAARTHEELCDLMLADAYQLAKWIPQGARVVDVGSGAGAPGLPLAILRPDLTMTLVEPLQKRVSFLRNAIGQAKSAVTVVRGKGEERSFGPLDVAISRATLPPPEWLALGVDLVLPEGEVWVLLAQHETPSVPGATILETKEYEWPMTHALRRAVRYRKL